MTLQRYFDTALGDPRSPLYTADKGDFGLARNSIQGHLHSQGRTLADTTLLDLAVPGWADSYFEYLYASYQSNKTKDAGADPEARLKWATRYLKCVRKVLNAAIRHALLPDCDYLTGISRLPQFKRERRPGEIPSASAAVAQLAQRGFTARPGSAPDLQLDPLDHYHLSLLSCAIEPKALRQLDPAQLDSGILPVPWAGTTVTLAPAVRQMLAIHLRQQPDVPVGESAIAAAMAKANLPLYQDQTVFADWLRFAKEQGVADSDIQRLAQLHGAPDKQCDPSLQRIIQTVSDKLASTRYNRYAKSWHCIIVRKGSAQDKYQQLAALSDAGQAPIPFFADRRSDFYYVDTDRLTARPSQRRSPSPLNVLRRNLFACLYPGEAQALGRQLSDIRFMTRTVSGKKSYAIIPAAELYRMCAILDAIRGTKAQIQIEASQPALEPLAVNQRVTVNQAGYSGYEAQVVAANPDDTYTVNFPNLGYRFILTNVPRPLLDAVATKSKA